MNKIILCSILILFLKEVFAQPNKVSNNIYGATVHWRPINNNSAIVLSYRLFWEQNVCQNVHYTSKDCLNAFVGYTTAVKVPSYFRGFKWRCRSGCTGSTTVANMSQLFFVDIGEFFEIKYESGIEAVNLNFEPSDDLANIKIGFENSTGNLVEGLGECHLSMAVRNDTKRANISPVLNVFPVHRVPLGCSIDIKLFPFDGDGDYVKCYWEKVPERNTKEFTAILNEGQCTIQLTAELSMFNAGDQLQLSLYAEDYSMFPVKLSGVSNDISTGPFSRTPLKLLVYIGPRTSGTDSSPSFTKTGTLEPYYKHSYMLPFNNALVKLPFETDVISNLILTTGPRYMKFSENNVTAIDKEGKEKTTSVDEGEWKDLKDPAMKGIHQACGTVYTVDGVPGESRCAVLMVNEPDECASSPCNRAPNGICDNLFEYYTCTYPGDPTYAHNRWTGPCEPERIIQKGDDNLGVKVGVPVALSLLLLLIIVGVTMYLKRYLTEKMKKSAVEPEEGVKAAGMKQ